MIRKMNIDDVDAVREIDKICFDTEKPRSSKLLNCYAKDNVSLVCEENGKVAAYIFNQVLGNFAWFGTFGVHPDFRGRNIGKHLIEDTVKMFREDYGIKNISLVTMPFSTYNVGFYINAGFTSRELSLKLSKIPMKSTASIKDYFSIETIDLNNQDAFENLKAYAKAVSSSIYEGLDMSNEISTAKSAHMGSGFIVYEDNVRIGFGILRDTTVFGEKNHELHLRLLCLKENSQGYKKALNSILSYMNTVAISKNLPKLSIDINTANRDVLNYFLKEQSFRIEKNSLNLSMGRNYLYTSCNGLILFRTVS